jgi:hypothetical protein
MEPKRTGRTFVAPNLKKTSVQIDREGNEIEIQQPDNKSKSLDDFLERRRKRMGR